jgi:hypothetical protein
MFWKTGFPQPDCLEETFKNTQGGNTFVPGTGKESVGRVQPCSTALHSYAG